jgi:hypothetical protein
MEQRQRIGLFMALLGLWMMLSIQINDYEHFGLYVISVVVFSLGGGLFIV